MYSSIIEFKRNSAILVNIYVVQIADLVPD